MTPVVYTADASRDVEDAVAWYETREHGLGRQLLTEIEKAETAITRSPTSFRILYRGTRRYLLRRFPYQLLYRVIDDEIVVVACFHARVSQGRVRRRG